jgi:large subunit ribosomal protein L9
MQIILLEKVANLGTLGDIVKVKAGFARNFLIPNGKAKRATAGNIAEFEQRRTDLEKAANELLAATQERASKLDGLMVQVTQKAGVDGRLFGSVTNYDISEALKAQGFEVSKGAVRLPQGPLKQVGDYDIVLDLHTDVKATIKVSVLGEQ